MSARVPLSSEPVVSETSYEYLHTACTPTDIFYVRNHFGVPPVDLIRADNSVIVDDVAYTGFKFAYVSPGTYDLRIRQTGTRTIFVTFPPQLFSENRVYTVYLFDAGLTARTDAGVPEPSFLIVRER